MSHDTDLIIRQDEKSKEGKRQKRKRRKKRKVGKEEREEEDDGMPQDKKPHVEDMEKDKNGDGKDDEKFQEKLTAHDEEMPSGAPSAAENPSEPGKIENDDPPTLETTHVAEDQGPKPSERKTDAGTHRAGFDAFMTGYIYAFATIRNTDESDSWIPACANKLYLSGKSVPLHIAKSTFSKSSRAHVTKMEQVWRNRFPKADGNV